jgi:uridylate kinase
MTIAKPAHKRILLKLSGEALMGDDAFGINRATIVRMVEEIAEVTRHGRPSGRGHWRRQHLPGRGWRFCRHGPRHSRLHGHVGHRHECLGFGRHHEQSGLVARVMSAIGIEQVVEPYVRPKALQYLEEGKVVIFAAGTGNPFFTTDTAAALRGAEIGANGAQSHQGGWCLHRRSQQRPHSHALQRISFDEAIKG